MGFVYETDLYTDKKKTDKVNEAKLKNQSLTKRATSDKKLAKEWMDFLKSKKQKIS